MLSLTYSLSAVCAYYFDPEVIISVFISFLVVFGEEWHVCSWKKAYFCVKLINYSNYTQHACRLLLQADFFATLRLTWAFVPRELQKYVAHTCWNFFPFVFLIRCADLFLMINVELMDCVAEWWMSLVGPSRSVKELSMLISWEKLIIGSERFF